MSKTQKVDVINDTWISLKISVRKTCGGTIEVSICKGDETRTLKPGDINTFEIKERGD